MVLWPELEPERKSFAISARSALLFCEEPNQSLLAPQNLDNKISLSIRAQII